MISKRLKGQKKSIIRQIVDSAPQNSVNLGLGELKISTFPKKNEIISEILGKEEIGYTPNAGLPALIEEIKRYYNQQAEYVCVTNGAEEAIFATLFSLLDSGDEVLLADPDYPAYYSIAKLLKVVPKRLSLDPTNNFQLDRSSLQKSVTSHTKAIVISNPSNPLGITYSQTDLDFIIKIANENNLVLIVDEIYNELILKGPRNSLIDQTDNIIVVSGLSKSYQLTGWRLGWAVTNKSELAKAITVSHQYISTCAGYVAQRLAQKILAQHQENSLDLLRHSLHHNKDLATKIINKNTDWHILKSQAAPYLFLNIKENSLEFAKQKAATGVVIIPGEAFGKNGTGWIRLNYAVSEKQLVKGLKLLAK